MNLLESLMTITMIGVFSRVLGFIKDTVIAKIFGTKSEIDAFFVAFRLPSLLRRMLVEGIFSQVFTPILAKYKNKNRKNDIQNLVSSMFGILMVVSTCVVAMGVLFSSQIIKFIAPGFMSNPEKFLLASKLSRIIFPYVLLVSISSLMSSILNVWNKLTVPVFSLMILNISMIFFSVVASRCFSDSVLPLAWSIVFSGVAQCLYQVPFLKKINMLIVPKFRKHEKEMHSVLKMTGPAVLNVLINQISLMVNTVLSSFLPSGSMSWMYYADRLIDFPSGVLGVALNTVLLPSLSHTFFRKKHKEYFQLINWGLCLCWLLTCPSVVVVLMLSKLLIMTLFQYGKFSVWDTFMTQKTLFGYSIGIIGFTLTKVLIASFYASQDIQTPILASIGALLFTQLMNLVFFKTLQHIGLAFSVGLGTCFNAVLLYLNLKKNAYCRLQTHWCSFFLKLMFASLVMSSSMFLTLMFVSFWKKMVMFSKLLRIVVVIFVGFVSYFHALKIMKIDLHKFYNERLFS